MDSLGPFRKAVEGVINFIWKHGVRHVTYIVHYKQNVLELNDSVRNLVSEKERIKHQSDEAEKNLNKIEGKVTEWVRKVGEIETIVKEFENDNGHKRARSPNYVFPYLWNRHKLGRKAKKMEAGVKKLIDESPKLDEVSYRQNVTSNDATLSNFDFEEFGSTKSTMEKVMRQLEDSTVRMIGLYGPGGVGKSTLVKEIARKAKEKKLFDVVVKVEITANPNLQNIQEEIAYVLGLRLEEEGENVRADCLRRRLKAEKRNILLILDDLWDKLDLNKLGIPVVDDDDDLSNDNRDLKDKDLEKNDDNNKDLNRKKMKKEKFLGSHKGCKILLTSRNKRVLCDEMDIKSTFCVQKLDDKDALMLFQKLVGIKNEMSDSKQEIVKKYCAGLPLAIVTVARALRSKSESVWETTLEKLKKQELVGVQTSMDISVKMSYDHLENEELKSIFLLCAQMGHQPLVMDLVRYCFGLGILEGISSLWEARDRINISIQKLKDSGLVLDGSSNNHFNMHDMVRDSTLSIAKKHRNVFTLRNGKLDDWPELESCASISICNCDITDGLPEVINCSQLKFFQIDTNDTSLIIPETFFAGMKNLKVLVLTGFRLLRLPCSIKCLLKLRMLCLERCTLDDNLSIGELKKLRILSFSGSQLKSLPIELGCLHKLQLLDISDCSIMEMNIPHDLLSRLTHLEELYIRKSLIKMFGETNQGQNLFLSELKNLHQLKVVDLSIPHVSILPNHLFFDRLKDYKIVVGNLEMFGGFRMSDKYETFRVLALQLNDDTNIHSQEDIKLLFKTVQSLLLGNVDGVQNFVGELNIDGFPDLKHLSIINNNHIKYVNSTELSNCVDVLPNLESLCLYNLGSLEMISYGPITDVSFAKLKAIKVEMCYRLENLYSFYRVKSPTSAKTCDIYEYNSFMDTFCANVEIIEVCECGSLKEILQIPVDYGKVEFLKLHTLTLQSLPSFTCFYTKVEDSCWPHLREAQSTNRCDREITNEGDGESDKTFPIFGELVEIPNLESLNISSLNIRKIWSNQPSSSFCFQNLIKLVVKGCHKLTYLCSLSMASSLKKLKTLVISECSIMENIFEAKGSSANKVCVFPKLEEIHLSKMNKLTNIWQTKMSVDSFSSLISVNIEECNELDKIFPRDMEGWFENLDNLKVSKCQLVEVIFEINDSQTMDTFGGIDTDLQVILLEELPKLKQLWSIDPNGILNFKKLRTIEVGDCNELRNLFPTSIGKDVPKLERMSVLHCWKIEEIVASQDASEANKDPLVFPELTYIRLYDLPNIKYFYKWGHAIKCPKLKELNVKLKMFLKETCKTTDEEEEFVFSSKEVFPNLEYMELDFEEAQELLPKYQMHRLKELSLISVKVDLLSQFPYRIPNLEKLKLIFSNIEVLVPKENFAQQKRLGITLELKELVLLHSTIKDLGLGRVPILRKLKLLSLESCSDLSNLGPPSVSLTYLTYLEVKFCRELSSLMASSTAKSMVQLKTMKVIYCPKVEQIVSNEGSKEDEVIKIVFNKLISIELVGLKNMRSFCSYKECEFEFPSLEILIVRECPKMEKFSERRSITPKLKDVFGVEGEEKSKWQWEGDLNATIQKIFNDKVTYSYIEDLYLGMGFGYNQYFELVNQLLHDSHWVQQNSFRSLKRLSVEGCDTLVHVIPSHFFSCFHNLEVLQVVNCRNVEVIFNINDENRLKKASGIFRLKKLSLLDLPKLELLWDKDPKGISLKVLEEVCVSRCNVLRSLFPASVAKDLTRLEVLQVTECGQLAEIFWKDEKGLFRARVVFPSIWYGELAERFRKDEKGDEGEGTTQQFVFAHLTSLRLEKLPRLQYSIHCSKEEESISNLSERDIQELCLGSWPIPNSSFGLLESLIVDGCQFLSDVFLPFSLLPFLTNLRKLDVANCEFVKTIFDITYATQEKDVTSTTISTLLFSLENLTLSKLPNLENVWNKDPRSILSMRYLKEVHVKKCKDLTSVFPASIAKDLVELENLMVEDCEGLMTIIAEDNTDLSGTHQQLLCLPIRSLVLRALPKLKYFYYCSLPGDNFAPLESHTDNQVCTQKCLSLGEKGVEMVLRGEFQKKLLNNIKFLTLYLQKDVFRYEILKELPNIEKLVVREGSLEEMFCCESLNNVDYSGLLLQLKVLDLESIKKLISIGSNLVACKVSFFGLTYLKVQSCDNLLYLFTSSTTKSLGQLKRMEIKCCDSIEEIVFKEGEESNEDEIIFPKLNYLNFERLENLSWFCSGSLSLPSLEELSVTDCHRLISLCTGTLEADKLSQVTMNCEETIPLKTDLNSIMMKTFLTEERKSREVTMKCDERYTWCRCWFKHIALQPESREQQLRKKKSLPKFGGFNSR